jgi:hypothetical protein
MSSERIEHAERLLDEHGVTIGPARVAVGRSGVAVGFPRDPMIHVAWSALALVALVWLVRRVSSGRSRSGARR